MKVKFTSILLAVLALSSCAFFKNQVDKAGQKEKPFTVDYKSPSVKVGESQAQFDNSIPFMPIRSSDITVSYFPVDDAVCLEYRIDQTTFQMFWNKDAREAYKIALNKYNEDFEKRNLRSNRSGTTKKAYGSVEGYITWKGFSYGAVSDGSMTMELGYYFRNNSPFFTVTQGEASSINYMNSDLEENISGERPVFFTRSQAEEIAALFDDELLNSHVQELQPGPEKRPAPPAEFDNY